jgi:hypothetical protein
MVNMIGFPMDSAEVKCGTPWNTAAEGLAYKGAAVARSADEGNQPHFAECDWNPSETLQADK